MHPSRLYLLAAAALWSTAGVLVKLSTLSAWQLASGRSLIAAVALAIALPAGRKRPSARGLLATFAYATTVVTFIVANKLTTSANSVFLQSTAPLYVLLASPFLLREKIRGRDLAFIAVVALAMGLFFVERPPVAATAPDPRLGNILALLSGVLYAAMIMGLRWLGSRAGGGESSIPTVVAGNAIACLACLPFALPAPVGAADVAVIGYRPDD